MLCDLTPLKGERHALAGMLTEVTVCTCACALAPVRVCVRARSLFSLTAAGTCGASRHSRESDSRPFTSRSPLQPNPGHSRRSSHLSAFHKPPFGCLVIVMHF